MNQTHVNGYARRGALFVPTLDLGQDVPAAPAPATVDGLTERVQQLHARVAEADRIRALPTERVLARRQDLAEADELDRLSTTDHARRLRAAGERERAELAAKAVSAASKRRLQADVDVRALTLTRRRRSRTLILWAVLAAAMSFTAVGVQRFAAGNSVAWSPQWVTAWLVDPLLSGLVVALLLTRGDLAAFGKPAHETRWDRVVVPLVEIGALIAALLMNVAPEIQAHSSWEAIALHIVIPLAAVASALALPVVQRRYSAGIAALYAPVEGAAEDAASVADTGTHDTARPAPVGDYEPDLVSASEGADETASDPVQEHPPRAPRRRRRKAPAKRLVLANYVDAARERLETGIEITPAWVRDVTGCSRATATKVVAVLQAAAD